MTGDDHLKDQSYFLWRLPQEVLRRCLFPLGHYTKQQVRQYLRDHGLTVKAEEGESMEVCFIQGDYRDFLRQQCPDLEQRIGPGWFVNSEGMKLGEHQGFPFYTIGQRRGLGIALGKPAFVLRINPQKNTVMLGDAEQLRADYMLIEQLQLVDEAEVMQASNQSAHDGEGGLSVRIRYRSKPIPCQLIKADDGQTLVRFLAEASAITPGQSAVFYIGQRLVGGAYIASQRGLGLYLSQLQAITNG